MICMSVRQSGEIPLTLLDDITLRVTRFSRLLFIAQSSWTILTISQPIKQRKARYALLYRKAAMTFINQETDMIAGDR